MHEHNLHEDDPIPRTPGVVILLVGFVGGLSVGGFALFLAWVAHRVLEGLV